MSIEVSALEIDRVLTKIKDEFAPKQENLIPGLQSIQKEFGYLPREAMLGLAKHLKVRESEVWGTVSFYAQFRFTPVGRNIFTICRGTACHVRGSAKIMSELGRELDVKPGGTTPDLEFTLQEVACFGSCALAPVILLNEKVYGRQTKASVKGLLDGIRQPSPDGSEPGKKDN